MANDSHQYWNRQTIRHYYKYYSITFMIRRLFKGGLILIGHPHHVHYLFIIYSALEKPAIEPVTQGKMITESSCLEIPTYLPNLYFRKYKLI